MGDLGRLLAANAGCRACALRPGCRAPVVGEGDPAAGLLIVADAPDGHDDRAGQPLTGPTGELLDRVLVLGGLSRSQAVVTTAVKCRPPADREPTPHELHTCVTLWLRPLLALIRPRVVLTLGRVATGAVLGTLGPLGPLRGRWFEVPDTPGALLMPLFHPAYLLREPGGGPGDPRALTRRDLREAAAVWRGDKVPQEVGPPNAERMRGQEGLF